MAVGITLAQVAAPGASPILRNATAAKAWFENYYKLVNQNFGKSYAKAISIQGLIYELAQAGGQNYKTIHGQLRQDTQVFMGGVSIIDPVVAAAANDWNAGFTADGTLPTDVPTLIAGVRSFTNIPEERLDEVIAFLRAQLRR